MAYKRYIKKNGKVYGPYIYKSIRDTNGEVKNIYVGQGKTSKESKIKKLGFTLQNPERKLELGIVILLAVSFISLYSMQPSGFVVQTKTITDTLTLNWAANDSNQILVNIDEVPKSVRISGYVIGNGTAKIYAVVNDTKHLIYQKEIPRNGISLTGMITGGNQSDSETSENPDKSVSVVTEKETETILQEEIVEEPEEKTEGPDAKASEIAKNDSNEDLIGHEDISKNDEIADTLDLIVPVENGTISLNKSAKKETEEVVDNETANVTMNNDTVVIPSIINETDVNVTIPNVTIPIQNVTIPEENETNISVPIQNETNISEVETNATEVDKTVDGPITKIPDGNITTNVSDFIITEAVFSDACIETCLVRIFPKRFAIIVEAESGTSVYIEEIIYDYEEIVVINTPPVLISDIPGIEIALNETYSLNLSRYFIDNEKDTLNYSFEEPDNIQILLSGPMADLIPEKNFAGERQIIFYASDGKNTTQSNIVNITVFRVVTDTPFEETIQYEAKVGEPVKWEKHVILPEVVESLSVSIHQSAENISAGKVEEKKYSEIESQNIKIKRDEVRELPIKTESDDVGISSAPPVFAEDGIEEGVEVSIEESVKEVRIKYFTEAPKQAEKSKGARKKEIVVYSDISYKNIQAKTRLPEEVPASWIHLYWVDNGSSYEVDSVKIDKNENSLIDEIEWVVSHTSNQTYILEIIPIIKALHLDSDRKLVKDIFEEVNTLDGNWSGPVNDSEYVRVGFEQPLGRNNDITIFARSEGHSQIEVFREDDSQAVAKFEEISKEGWYKIYLYSLDAGKKSGIFDLKIIGDHVEFDFIVDPSGPPDVEFQSPTPADGNISAYHSMSVKIYAQDSQSNVSIAFNYNDSLVAWWRFDDVNGTGDPSDYFNTYNGSKGGNAAQINDGAMGKGFEFDGDGDYIVVPHDDVFDLDDDDDFGLSFWINWTNASAYGSIFSKGFAPGGSVVRYRVFTLTDGKLRFNINDGVDNDILDTTSALNDGKWHHYVITTKRLPAGQVSIYVDGVHDKTSYIITDQDSIVNTQPVYIGSRNQTLNFLNGSLDDIIYFNRTISADEAKALYANQTSKYHIETYSAMQEKVYTITGYAQDSAGNINSTEPRDIEFNVFLNMDAYEMLGTPSKPTDSSLSLLNATFQYLVKYSDDDRLVTSKAKNESQNDTQVFLYNISEDIVTFPELRIINFTWEGFGETESPYLTRISLFHWAKHEWIEETTKDFIAETDDDLSVVKYGNDALDYINYSTYQVGIMVETSKWGCGNGILEGNEVCDYNGDDICGGCEECGNSDYGDYCDATGAGYVEDGVVCNYGSGGNCKDDCSACVDDDTCQGMCNATYPVCSGKEWFSTCDLADRGGESCDWPCDNRLCVKCVCTNCPVECGGGDTPFIYTFSDGEYSYLTDYFHTANSPEKGYPAYIDITDRSEILNGVLKLKITEEKNETSYLDKLHLIIYEYPIGKDSKFEEWKESNFELVACNNFALKSKEVPDYVKVGEIYSNEQDSLTKFSDNRYVVMERGYSKELSFNIPALEKGYLRKIMFVGEGYYITYNLDTAKNIDMNSAFNRVVKQGLINIEIEIDKVTRTKKIIRNNRAKSLYTDYVTMGTGSDIDTPNISFVSPTPSDGDIIDENSIYVKASYEDAYNVSSVIDFNNTLIGWYRFDDVNGSNDPTDYTNNINCSAVGAAAQTNSGYLGKGFAFDGDGDYVTCGNEAFNFTNTTAGFTLCAWVKSFGTGMRMIVAKSDYGGTNKSYWLYQYSTGQAYGAVYMGITNYDHGKTTGVLTDELWHHVCVTYNNQHQGLRMYFDGTDDTTGAAYGGSVKDYTNDEPFVVGINSVDGGNDFNGSIDDVLIFDRPLGADEVNAIYANTSSGFVQHNYTGLDEGNYSFIAYAQDLGGHVNSTEEYTVTVDILTNISAYDMLGIPSSPSDGSLTEATALEYLAFRSIDNSRWMTAYADDDGEYDSQVYIFDMSSVITDIGQLIELNLTWEGYGENVSTYFTNISYWNWDKACWEEKATSDFTSSTDADLYALSYTYEARGYVNSTSKHVAVLVTTRRNVSTSPFLYTYRGGKYSKLSDFIPGAVGMDKEYTSYTDITDETEIQNGKVRLLVTNELDETAYLDKYNLVIFEYDENDEKMFNSWFGENFNKVNGYNWRRGYGTIPEHVKMIKLNSNSHDYKTLYSDDLYSVLNKGHAQELWFDYPEQSVGKKRKMFFASEGYYENNEVKTDKFDKGKLSRIFNAAISQEVIGKSLYTDYIDLGYTLDTAIPNVSFEASTPDHTDVVIVDYIEVNTSVTDTNNVSLFIDFDRSLKGWWRMDDVNQTGVGALVEDYLGINNGTAYGNAVQTNEGYLGKGMSFPDSGNISGIGQILQAGETDVSFGGWVRYDSIANDGTLFDVIMHHSDSNELGFQMYSFKNDESIKCFCNSGDANLSHLSTDTWYHFMCVWNSSNIYLYVNGMLADSDTHSESIQASSEFEIGNMYGKYQFNGTIDDVVVFNRTLTAAEVLELYANETARNLEVNFTGLVLGGHFVRSYSQDIGGNVNSTSQRTIYYDPTAPVIDLNAPVNMSNETVSYVHLNSTASDNYHNDMTVIVYGSNSTATLNSEQNSILGYFMNVDNATDVVYNYSAKPIDPDDANLILALHFDNESSQEGDYTVGGTVNDWSSQNNDGTIGGTLLTYNQTNGRFGGSFEPNITSYAFASVDNSDFNLGTTTNFTIAAWVRKSSQSATSKEVIFEHLDGASRGYRFLVMGSGVIRSRTIPTSGSDLYVDGSTNLLDGEWHHVAVTADRNGNMQLYVDGETDGSAVDISSVGSLSVSGTVYVGRSRATGYNAFNGSIDDLGVWNRLLSASEIKDLARLPDDTYYWKVTVNDSAYQTTSETREFTVYTVKPTIALNAPADEAWQASTTVTFNYTANHTLGVDTCILYADFDGTWKANETNDSVISGYPSTETIVVLPNSTYTWNVWCNNSYKNFGNGGFYPSNYTLYIGNVPPAITLNYPQNESRINSTEIYFNWTASSQANNDFTCNLTINGEVNVSDIDVTDGVLYSQKVSGFVNRDHNWSVTCWVQNEKSFISTSSAYDFRVDSTIPAVNFTSPTTSSTSIQTQNYIYINITSKDSNDHYTFIDFDNDLQMWIRFDDRDSSGNLIDLSSYANNCTTHEDASLTGAGRYGHAYTYDGDGDYNAIQDLYYDTAGEISELTVCAWIKTTDASGYIIDFDRDEYWSLGINIFDSPGTVSWDTADTGGTVDNMESGVAVNDGDWHFICGVFDRLETNEKKIYIDGSLDSQKDSWSTGDTIGSGTTRYGFIGDGSSAASYNGARKSTYFNGTLDEIFIFHRALALSEIKSLYNASTNQYEYNLTDIDFGSHTVTGYSVDLTGNKNQTAEETITIDMDSITSCGSLTQQDTVYTLANTITDNLLIDNCITITATNVTFDCNDFSIQSSDNYAGVYSDQVNSTITDCYISMGTGAGGNGIELRGSNQTYIQNVTLNSQYTGLYVYGSVDTALYNLTANSNQDTGIYLNSSSNISVETGLLDTSSNYLIHILSNSENNTFRDMGLFDSSSDAVYIVGDSYNTTFDNITIIATSSANSGIYTESMNTTVKHCNITMKTTSGGFGIELNDANYSYFLNNTLNDQRRGLFLFNTSFATLINNTIDGNYYGLYINYSTDGTLKNNTMSDNTYNFFIDGIVNRHFDHNIGVENSIDSTYRLYYNYSLSDFVFNTTNAPNAGAMFCVACDNVTINDVNLSADDNWFGLFFYNTNNSRIENVSTPYQYNGVYLEAGSNNTITDNSLSNATNYGLTIDRGTNNSITNNEGLHNYDSSIYLLSTTFNSLINNTINFNDNDGIYLESSTNNTITNNTAKLNDKGIYLVTQSHENTIENNTLVSNNYGLRIYSSNNNTVKDINAYLNANAGIHLQSSNYTNVTDCNVSKNNGSEKFMSGIFLQEAYFSTISDLTANYNIDPGIHLKDSHHNVITNTRSDGNSVDFSGGEPRDIDCGSIHIGNDYISGIFLHDSTYNNISNAISNSNSGNGVTLCGSDYNNLTNITASSNNISGVSLFDSESNNITNITASSNLKDGVYINRSAYNTFYDITASSNTGSGLALFDVQSIWNNITKIEAHSNEYGIECLGRSNDFFDMELFLNTDDGIRIGNEGNNFTNVRIIGGGALHGIYLTTAVNNIYIKNFRINDSLQMISTQTQSAIYDIFLHDGILEDNLNEWIYVGSATNFNSYNVSYGPTFESLTASGKYWRYWYYSAYVNDTSGNPLNNVAVKAYDKNGVKRLDTVTNSTGWTPKMNLIEYYHDGSTRNFYSNYTINATNVIYVTGSQLYNVSADGNNLKHVFTLTRTNNVTSCVNLDVENETYLVTGPLSTSGTCINITADNVTLNCDGNNITGQFNGVGISVNSTLNTTVLGCEIQNFSRALHVYNSNNSLFDDLIIHSNIGPYAGIFSKLSYYTNFTNTNSSYNNGTLNGGIFLQDSDDLFIDNITMIGNELTTTSNFYGAILLLNQSHNNTIVDVDIIDSDISASNDMGVIGLYNAKDNNFTGGSYNLSSSHIILLESASINNNFTSNTLYNASDHAVLVRSASYDNTFKDMVIDLITNSAFNFTSSDDNSLINNTISNEGWDYYLYDSNVLKYAFTDASLEIENSNGELRFINTTMNASGSNLSDTVYVISNYVFVNSSADSGFNTSANITLSGISYLDPVMQVDLDDDGSWITCPSTVCTNISYIAGTSFKFNVTHFTGYRSGEGTPLTIMVLGPLNNTRYATNSVVFNVSLNMNASWCGFSMNDTANVSMNNYSVSAGFDYTKSGIAESSHNVTFYCNDTNGNMYTSGTYNFVVDMTNPAISFETPTTPVDNSYWNLNYTYLNVSASDTNEISTFVDFDDSLISWWRMDERNSTGDIVEYFKRINGTVMPDGEILPGQFGDGIDFDSESGTGVVFQDHEKASMAGNFTVALWIYPRIPDDGSGTMFKLSGGSNTLTVNCEYILRYGTSGYLAATIGNGTDADTTNFGNILTFNEWNFIACGINETNDIWCSVNGVLDDTSEARNLDFIEIGNWTIIGQNGNAGSATSTDFNGTIDDVMIFNRTLSIAEIGALYANMSTRYYLYPNHTRLQDGVHSYTAYTQDIAGNIATDSRNVTVDTVVPEIGFRSPMPDDGDTITINYIYANVTASDSSYISTFIDHNDSLISWWRMDDVNQTGVGALVADYMNAYNGTAMGNAEQTYDGYLGKGYEFGGNGDEIDLSSISLVGANWTISWWQNYNGDADDMTMPIGDDSGSSYIGTYYNLDDVYVANSTGFLNARVDNVGFSEDVWTMCTLEGNETDMWFYKDGEFKGYALNAGKRVGGGFIVSSIGTGYPVSTYDFNGTIDDVMIFNRTLTLAEVASLYANQSTRYYLECNFTNLDAGTHVFTAYAQDRAGNVNNTAQWDIEYSANSNPDTTSVVLNTSSNDNYTTDNLLCYAKGYDEDDTELNAYYIWYRDNNLYQKGNTTVTNGTTALVSTMVSSKTNKSDIWNCSVIMSDFAGNESEWNNESITIRNTAPGQVSLTTPADGGNTTNRSVTFVWVALTDADNDVLNYTLNISCHAGCSSDNTSYTVNASDVCAGGSCSYTIPIGLNYFGDDNYYYNWTVQAFDDEVPGTVSDRWNFSLLTNVTLTLYVNDIDFNTLALGSSNDTTNDDPPPFKMRNDGNCFLDVNISSSDLLWDSQASASQYFEYQIGNVTGEENSLNWSSPNTTYPKAYIPTVNGSAISNLNYSDASDEAEIDIFIEVPVGEQHGQKNSQIMFVAGYNSEED